MQYTLSRSKHRRTIGITIKHGEVRVAAPSRMAQHYIDSFIASKQTWINRHVQTQQQKLYALPPRIWQHGETVYWLGQPFTLQVRDGQRNTIEAIDKNLHIRIARRTIDKPAQVRKLVRQWFSEQGQIWLDQNIAQFSAARATPPAGWRVANYTAKWGACNSARQLSFSWRLFTAPEWVVRYVALHELCHLTHFNHSAKFWALVQHYDPTYKQAEAWLKIHGHTILNDKIFNFVIE